MIDLQAEYTAIGRAVERAAEILPEGYSMVIDVERGAGVVSIVSPTGDTMDCDFGGDTFSGQINAAIDFAIAHERGDADAQ